MPAIYQYLRIIHDGYPLAQIPLPHAEETGTEAIFTLNLSEIQAAVGADRLQLKNIAFVAKTTPTTHDPS